MKTRKWFWMIPLLLAAGAAAQDGSADRITVPFSDPARPKTVKGSQISGSFIVHGYDGKELVIEARGIQRKPAPPRADGLRRIDNNRTGIEVQEDSNVVKISAAPWGTSNVVLQVPRDTSLSLKVINGEIEVEGVSGEVNVESINGAVSVRNVSGAVLAHALNGPLKAVLDRVPPDKAMSFSSLNGEIDVTLPASTHANLRIKSDFGEVYSDFEMKIDTSPQKPVVETIEGRGHRVKTDKTMLATINGGGPEIQFTTLNGKIFIRKGK